MRLCVIAPERKLLLVLDMQLTPRQQRRLEKKLARKAAKKLTSTQQNLAQNVSEQGEIVAPAPFPAPVSEAKLAANRGNSQLSTGPVSSAGKAISSQNRTRHGLSGSKFRVMPDESQADFDEMLAHLLEDHVPADQTETEFVHQLAEAFWLARRAMRLQDACLLAIESGDQEVAKTARKDLALYLRYQTTHDRTASRCLTELRKCRNERRRVERGFESQKLRAAQETRKQETHRIRQAIDRRKQERHEMSLLAAQAKLERKQQHKNTTKPELITTGTAIPTSIAAGA